MGESRLKTQAGLTLAVLSIVLLPPGTFRPNRVVSGIPLDLWIILESGGWLAVAVGSLLAIGCLYAVIKPGGNYFKLLKYTPWLLSAAPGLVILLLSRIVASSFVFDMETARISLGFGFWLFIAGILLMQRSALMGAAIMTLTVVIALAVPAAGLTPYLALFREFVNIKSVFYAELRRHLTLSLASVGFAILPGILLGYACHTRRRLREWILGAVNLFQVAPTLSLLGLIMIPLTLLSKNVPFIAALGIRGIGFTPAFIVLVLYCLLPITANAYSGFDQVEGTVIDSAKAMGMTRAQIFWQVHFPLALPVIFSGIRTAVTQNVGNTILAGLIGGGGMGALIFLGLSQSASDLVVLGTIPVVVMALVLEAALKSVEKRITVRAGVAHDSAEAGI